MMLHVPGSPGGVARVSGDCAADGDELEAARAQRWYEQPHRLDRDLAAIARFVHQDDAARARALEDPLDDLVRGLTLPVIAVDVPQHEALRESAKRAHRPR